MKKLYSIILLGAYLVGIVQPILPMIRFQLDHSQAIEYAFSGASQSNHSNSPAHIAARSKNDQSKKAGNNTFNLMRDSFYPVGVAISTVHEPVPLAKKKVLHLVVSINTNEPTYLPNSPPPQYS